MRFSETVQTHMTQAIATDSEASAGQTLKIIIMISPEIIANFFIFISVLR